MTISQSEIAHKSGDISKPIFQVVFAVSLSWFQSYDSVLGDNRSGLRPVSSVGYCTGGTSNIFSSKSFSGWLHRTGCSGLSLRSEWASLWILRLLLLEWSTYTGSISLFTAGTWSAHKIAQSFNHLRSCLPRFHVDHDFRRQIFFFSIF